MFPFISRSPLYYSDPERGGKKSTAELDFLFVKMHLIVGGGGVFIKFNFLIKSNFLFTSQPHYDKGIAAGAFHGENIAVKLAGLLLAHTPCADSQPGEALLHRRGPQQGQQQQAVQDQGLVVSVLCCLPFTMWSPLQYWAGCCWSNSANSSFPDCSHNPAWLATVSVFHICGLAITNTEHCQAMGSHLPFQWWCFTEQPSQGPRPVSAPAGQGTAVEQGWPWPILFVFWARGTRQTAPGLQQDPDFLLPPSVLSSRFVWGTKHWMVDFLSSSNFGFTKHSSSHSVLFIWISRDFSVFPFQDALLVLVRRSQTLILASWSVTVISKMVALARQGMLVPPVMFVRVSNLNYFTAWLFFWLIKWNFEATVPYVISVAVLSESCNKLH